MPQYLIRFVHSSDQCPTANSKVRERVLRGMPAIPDLASKLGLKFVIGPLVLASEHEGFAVVESDKAESVEDFVMQSGLMQWNSVRITPTQTLPEALNHLDSMPPPLY